MENDLITRCRSWFAAYARSFTDGSEGDRQNYSLKETHTLRVLDNALRIAEGLGLGARERSLAGAVALFHDVGRFPQYRDYRTFRDSESKNHAVLSSRVLLHEGVLRDLPREDRDTIVRSVTLHNVFSLPSGLGERTLLHSRIIRDADKLDIWRVFIELLALPRDQWPSAAGLGLPDRDGCSADILSELEHRRMLRLTQLGTLNDFKLLQLGWVYDLNFLPSLRLARDREIVERLASTLPRTVEIARAVDAVRGYVDERLS